MTAQDHWQWQEPGTTWKGVGLYHFTLTVSDRRPRLGALEVPDGDPSRAHVRRTALGDALVDCLLSIPRYHPEVEVLHFCLMPDHLHAVLYVRRTMPSGIRALARGFWQGAKKLGRAWTAGEAAFAVPNEASSVFPNDIREEYKEGGNGIREEFKEGGMGRLKEASARLQAVAATLCGRMGTEAYYRLAPVFEEMPFIRAMARYSQLPTTIRYIDMNPQRLATKRMKPGFFRVQKDIEIGARRYDGVGNAALLTMARYDVVHVRSVWVKAAERGQPSELRNYMNSRVLKAREGVVMVSPYISTQERQVLEVLMREQHPAIMLTDNGFRDYYKPADWLFDACAAGRLLILSPWPYDAGKRHISRAECMALNAMAEEICQHMGQAG